MASSQVTRQTTAVGLSVLTLTVAAKSKRSLLVLFIPGYASQASDYEGVISLLAISQRLRHLSAGRSQRYVAIDLPGYGETPQSVTAEPGIAEFARLVNTVKHELTPEGTEAKIGATDVVLVGHSLAGRVVLEAFLQDRGGVKGILLLDASHYLLRPKAYLEQQQAIFGRQQRPEAKIEDLKLGETGPRLQKSDDEIRIEREQALERLFTPMFSALTPPGFKAEKLAQAKGSMQYLVPLRRSVIKWDQEKMDTAVKTVGAAGIQVLVLQSTDGSAGRRPLAVGEEDGWMRFVKDRIDGANYEGVVVDGCGHFPHVDRPEAVAEVLERWLVRVAESH